MASVAFERHDEREAGVRLRVAELLDRLPREAQYPSQGRTVFVDLERLETREAYTPLEVVKTFLEGRGGNMYYLYNLLDPALEPLDPEVPLIFGSGLLTGIVPSAARGNVTSRSPETGLILDCNAGDYFPSFLKLSRIDRLVFYGRARRWTMVLVEHGELSFVDASAYEGLDNIDLRDAVARDLAGTWARDLAMVNVTRAGENLVKTAGIMAGPKALYARGGPGAKMGSLRLKCVVVKGPIEKTTAESRPGEVKPYNKHIAKKLLETGVVKSALKVRGTPFLYKPSRLLGAMGTRNNQETTWSEELDAEHLDPFRPGMEGCFRCPVNCRPLNDLHDQGKGDRYDAGDGPEYVTLGKFGPNLAVKDPRAVIRLNNICNDLGFDTASMGSAISWALELYQRGIIDRTTTGGLELAWGDAALFEKLLFMTSRREGFGDVLAESAAAVDAGRYPRAALRYRMAVKGLMQSDPHDARILKAFALGLAVATRGMDHLRNRVTLEINAKINDDPAFKASLYGGAVAAAPNSYEGKEVAVRRCENMYAVGDSVGMCRFTTQLFNSPSLPGYEEFSKQIANLTGIELSEWELDRIGLNIVGLERLLNHRMGARKADDTLPERWFEEPITVGRYAGEKIDRAEFAQLLDRFYALSGFDDEGQPKLAWRRKLARVLRGQEVAVRLPSTLADLPEGTLVVDEPVATVGEVMDAVERRLPGLGRELRGSVWTAAVNGEVLLQGRESALIKDGDEVEFLPMFAGG